LTRRSKRRVEILRAAARTFRARGFHAAAMTDIAADLGMTKGNLYYYFRDKEEILYFCQEASLHRMLKTARDVTRRRISADAKLHELIVEQVRCMLDELHGSGAHLETPQNDRIVRKRDEYEAILRGVIAEGVRRGTFRPVDPKLAGLAILGAVNWSARWYRPDAGATPDQIGQTFATMLVRGLK
jgi:AcrR family transcriptional regulator